MTWAFVVSLALSSCGTPTEVTVAGSEGWWVGTCDEALTEMRADALVKSRADEQADTAEGRSDPREADFSVVAAYPTTTEEMADRRDEELNPPEHAAGPRTRDDNDAAWRAEDREVALCYFDGDWSGYARVPSSMSWMLETGYYSRMRVLVDRETEAITRLNMGTPEQVPTKDPRR